MNSQRVKVSQWQHNSGFLIDVFPRNQHDGIQRMSLTNEEARDLYRMLAAWFAGGNVVGFPKSADYNIGAVR